MEIIKFFGLLALIYLFVEGSAPVQFIKGELKLLPESKTRNVYLQVLAKLFNCALCSGFWIGVMMYFKLIPEFVLYAAFVSVCSELFYRVWIYLTNGPLGKL